MPHYICLIYGKDDKVALVENFDHPEDAAAIAEAEAIATSHMGCRGYELWNNGKKVSSTLPKGAELSAHERFPNK